MTSRQQTHCGYAGQKDDSHLGLDFIVLRGRAAVFVSGIFHMIFLNHGRPQVAGTDTINKDCYGCFNSSFFPMEWASFLSTTCAYPSPLTCCSLFTSS